MYTYELYFCQNDKERLSDLTVYKSIENLAEMFGQHCSIFQSGIVVCNAQDYEIRDGFKVVLDSVERDFAKEFVDVLKDILNIDKVYVKQIMRTPMQNW